MDESRFQAVLEEQGFIIVGYEDLQLMEGHLSAGRPISGTNVVGFPPGALMMPIGRATNEEFSAQYQKLWGMRPWWNMGDPVGFLKMVLE